MNIFIWLRSHVLGKKYLHNHSSFDYPFRRTTNLHSFNTLIQNYVCWASAQALRMGRGTERRLEDRVPALPVCSLRAGNRSMIIPAPKELKQSFVLSFTKAQAHWESTCTSASACLWLWLARSQNKELVQRTRSGQAELTCTFSCTHEVPHHNFSPKQNLQGA